MQRWGEIAVTDSSRAMLRQLLAGGYGDLKARLTQQLGSADLASDALQDTWLKLETAAPLGHVRHPQSYLFRIALNIALKRKRRAQRTVSLDEAREVLDTPLDAPGPDVIAETRQEVVVLKTALAELTPRQLHILLAYRLQDVSLDELAAHFEVSKRSIARDLRHAVLHCAERLGKNS